MDGCTTTGKHRYTSKGAALSVARSQNRRNGRAQKAGRVTLEAYNCKACAGWHLTSHTKRWAA